MFVFARACVHEHHTTHTHIGFHTLGSQNLSVQALSSIRKCGRPDGSSKSRELSGLEWDSLCHCAGGDLGLQTDQSAGR